MGETKNLMGLNLSVDNDLIAEAAKEAIVAGVAASLEMKERLVSEFVKSMLTEQVRVEDGQRKQYSSDKCCSRMEYLVRKAFGEIVRDELINMIEEQKPVLRELIRNEFKKKDVQSKFVEMFMDSLSKSISNRYTTKIAVEFDKEEAY